VTKALYAGVPFVSCITRCRDSLHRKLFRDPVIGVVVRRKLARSRQCWLEIA
jgi:hypothetical protein